MGLEAEGVKMVTPTKHGAGKGFMKGPSTTQENHPSSYERTPNTPWRGFRPS